MSRLGARPVTGQVIRFVGLGAANTAVTGGIFYLLASVVAPWLAYTAAFLLGIAFAVAVTPRVVFLRRPPLLRRVLYGLWYLLIYLVGLLAVGLLDYMLGAPRLVVVGLTIVLTSALSFLGARRLFNDDTGGFTEP